MDANMIELILRGIGETLYMTVGATVFSYVLGLPVGVLLYVTDRNGLFFHPSINKTLGFLVNFFRSVPFIILLVWLLPFTRWIVGTTLSSTATMVPLVIAASPLVARMVQASLQEIKQGTIEAAQAMGSSNWQIITKVLLGEAKPSLITGFSIVATIILGYSTMAGFTGGGGLGAIAINYGYHRYQTNIMLLTVVLLAVLVQIIQEFGTHIAKKTDRRIKS